MSLRPSQLTEYLTYYQTCNQPGFAVLVTGAWGTGKTFQVRNAIPKTACHYISLFGLKTSEEVHAEVAAAMDPHMTGLKKVLNAGAMVGNAAPGAYKLTGASSALINSFIKTRTKNDKTIIFDDLERCSLHIRETLGLINQYVEHFGCRVIVIAHDGKLTDEFLNAKEKVFGQTIEVEPQIENAFSSFCDNQKSSSRKQFLNQYKEKILSVFSQSGASSLRILKHVMEDVGRLFDIMPEKHLAKADAIAEVVGLFCALDIEIRGGLIQEAELRDRRGRSIRYRLRSPKAEPAEQPAIMAANSKYADVDLESDLLTDEVLVKMLVKGLYNAEELTQSLDGSVHFAAPAALPNWRVVMSFDDVEDGDLQLAQSSMDADFNSRAFCDPGVILHVFGLKLMMAENAVVPETLDQVRDACKLYIADLLASGRLPPRTNDWRWDQQYDRSYGGYGYWVTPAAEPFWRELYDSLNQARDQALTALVPTIVSDILTLTKTDGEALYRKLNSTSSGVGEYAFLPVLHCIPVREFFDAWMQAPKDQWRWITNAIKSRFTASQNSIGLDKEVAWYNELVELMKSEAATLNGFQALRLRRAIPKP